jgi:hypothetical protein
MTTETSTPSPLLRLRPDYGGRLAGCQFTIEFFTWEQSISRIRIVRESARGNQDLPLAAMTCGMSNTV